MQLRFIGRVGGLAVAGLATTLLLSSPATAADDVTIMHVQPDGESVQVLVSMPESGQGSQDVSLTIDGETTEATVEAAGDSTDIRRTTVLGIATSIRMADGSPQAPPAATTHFLSSVHADHRAGLLPLTRHNPPTPQPHPAH